MRQTAEPASSTWSEIRGVRSDCSIPREWRERRPFETLQKRRRVLSSSILTATAGSDVVQSGRQIFDDFFQHLWPYIGNNTANVVFQMVKRLWLIHIDQ
ncbi:hypothetical protein TNCV_438791 [Trichonephila clavipes]|nr:hypothetical protein TNCV_438791 [Trichonephila clavipes]